jgi:hypothetical protein
MDLDPRPGRILLIGPTHTLLDVATAIDLAFARWDLAHLHEFEFADGRRYGIRDEGSDQRVIDYDLVKACSVVNKGETFSYVFDFGDDWRHSCQVVNTRLDPIAELGIVPRQPTPIWGWGSIPDQYGRRWDGDTGEE